MSKDQILDELDPERRLARAFLIRTAAAGVQRDIPLPDHPHNNDDEQYANHIGSYTKALPRDGKTPDVDPAAYNLLRDALASGVPAQLEKVPLGGVVKLSNPQAAYAFSLDGPDGHHTGIPAAPAFHSAEQGAELVEDYWMALLRDTPFRNYGSDPLAAAAVDDLSRLAAFSGPRDGGKVTPQTLFRGPTAGDLAGPFISQFLWLDVPCGAIRMQQRYRTPVAGDDHMIAWDEWLAIQTGAAPKATQTMDPVARYVRDGRGLAEFVHKDFVYQAYLNAALVLLERGALSPSNPYGAASNQVGFVTFGPVQVLDLLGRVARTALKAAWYQKWLVHRRGRPEEYAGRVHQHKVGGAAHPLPDEVLNSRALAATYSRHGSYLLPQAYPEGAPTHPSYPAGHACVAGACATLLKAYFNEKVVLADPVEATADGLTLAPWTGAALTVGGELNKLAANIALGRDVAGVHWRSDGVEGLKLGEAVALNMLKEDRATYSEPFTGFTLTRFDGTSVTV